MSGIGPVNLAAIDLNLLVALEALLAEQNVSRAASRVGLAQPSMSNALGRLRMLFEDELFIRTSRGVRPTERAAALARPLAEALAQIRRVLASRGEFDPRRDARWFNVGASDQADFALLPGTTWLLRERGPAVNIHVRALHQHDAVALLDDGVLDVVVAAFSDPPARFETIPLYAERYVCICRRDHPTIGEGPLSLEQFLALPHIVVGHERRDRFDSLLADCGLRRRTALVLPNFAALPMAVITSDLVAVVGSRVAARLSRTYLLDLHELPLTTMDWRLCVYRGPHSAGDPGTAWLIEVFQEAAAAL